MKTVVVLSCLLALSIAAPPNRVRTFRDMPALRHEEVHDEYGQYAFRYITADNTVVSERGHLVPTASGGYVMVVEGQYEFVGDDGHLYVTKYQSGPDGFHVYGDHLPKSVTEPSVYN